MGRKDRAHRPQGEAPLFGKPALAINVMGRLKNDFEKMATTMGVKPSNEQREKTPRRPRPPFVKQKVWTKRAPSAAGKSGGGGAAIIEKSDDERHFILAALENNFLFLGIDDAHLQKLVNRLEPLQVKDNQYVMRQGDVGDYLYILRSGTVAFEVDGTEVGRGVSSSPKDKFCVFGELALLYSAPRAASVRTKSDCTLYRLDKRTFQTVLKHGTETDTEKRISLLKQVTVLQDLDSARLNKLANATETLRFKKGDYLFRRGESMNSFFIIESGVVHGSEIDLGGSKYEDVWIGTGKPEIAFGWRIMMGNMPKINANIVADTPTVTALVIDKQTFQQVVGDVKEVVQEKHRRLRLQAIAVFRDSHLDQIQLAALADLMILDVAEEDKVLYNEGDEVNAALCFVESGHVVMESNQGNYTKTIEMGGYFGDDQLLADQHADSGTIESSYPSVEAKYSLTITKGTTLRILYLEDARKVVNTSLLGLGQKTTVSAIDNTLRMEDLTRHVMLGSGSFGQVWLTSAPPAKRKHCSGGGTREKEKSKRRIFALKVQSKYQLLHTEMAEAVVAERNIMACLNSPFIIRLYNTYQDPQRVYLLTSLLQGGELEALIVPRHGMYESDAKFYAAGILEGITYMHRRHIIHRDLKPENVLINDKGYPVIIDLGFAKYVPDKTYTFCGTPMYIAPEVISYQGHDKSADHWSWACMIYELVTGSSPFYEHGMDELSLFKRICRGQFTVSGKMSFELKLLLVQVLVPDRAQRLGSLARGWHSLYDAPWFGNVIKWKKLRKQEIPAPWVPDLDDPLDASNFDDQPKDVEDKMTAVEPGLTPEQQEMFKTF